MSYAFLFAYAAGCSAQVTRAAGSPQGVLIRRSAHINQWAAKRLGDEFPQAQDEQPTGPVAIAGDTGGMCEKIELVR